MGYDQAWLRYGKDKPKEKLSLEIKCKKSPILENAIEELKKDVRIFPENAAFTLKVDSELPKEGYRLQVVKESFFVYGGSDVGILYGVFALIRAARTGKLHVSEAFEETKIPACPLRMLNHWDNMDGSIERGYAGNSLFFKDEKVHDHKRLKAYARLCASVGINGTVLNNVNVRGEATYLIDLKHLLKVKSIADLFADYGIKIFLSVNFAAPMTNGGLETADPLDPKVRKWWRKKAELIYKTIPNFGGFLVKADSEGRPGPFSYGRTHADGANMLAEAVAPFGGVIIWRCFVYNCQQDWRDQTVDRARAGYDNFMPLDGQFSDNVILQIKNGPMDFQVREPVSPLFGGLTKTNQMLEVQAAQEYTGQQKDCCYLVPIWKQVLEFKTCAKETDDKVKDIITGKTFGQTIGGMCAVANTGTDENWCGHDLAQANWYGFGRISFDPELTPEEIAEDFVKEAYGKCGKKAMAALTTILLQSTTTYEKYTAPLGIGWMVNPNHHYGVNVEGYEYDRWGTYHRASHSAIGVERNSSGTGYSTQYLGANKAMYEKVETTPEELLLFFHRVPYSHRLRDGRTVLQYIYDTHFEGVEEVEQMIALLESVQEKIEPERYTRLRERFSMQLLNAVEWRDRVNTYFHRITEIPDEKGRKIFD